MKDSNFQKGLIKLLSKHTGCSIQHNGCPCNSCFFNLAKEIGLNDEFAKRLWSVVLVLRGDYTQEEILGYEKEDVNGNS
jgi:hypothetical protein